MSTTIDERVVEMRFDNKHFENNVSTTMSTLDKLKQKLNLSGASKGLENVSTAAQKVDLSPLSRSTETVGLKFNAMYTIADQALRNITNSAMMYGKRIVNALTIDPVKTGFQEYELKMNSVQTIMASTGETIETVNKYLEELNKYSDMTIYSFSDMTSNIGKFTNAGVKLEDAVAAIKGISNEAALSGANANEASRAMYNFSQALSAGYVKLIDWKSIENANMATMGFKEELIKTALALGTVTDEGEGMYKTLTGKTFNATKNFNDVLQEQWMTSEVLIETLKKYADSETEIGAKATEAATKVKTFTQLWDTLKEAAQSGWARSWELLIGNLEQAKELLTSISKVVGGFIDRTSDWRNTLLEGVLGSPFARIKDLLENSGLGMLDEYTKNISNLADMLEYYQKVVKEVWRGNYNNRGDDPDRFDLLTGKGYNPHIVQNLVNLGVDHTLTVEDLEAAYAKWGETAEGTAAITEKIAIDLENLTDEQLRNIGFTEAEIRLFRELQRQAKAAGKSLNEFLEERASMTGRQMLIDSLKGIARVLGEIGAAIGKAWEAIFNPAGLTDEEKMSNYIITLYTALTKFYNFAAGLTLADGSAEKLTRTFKGLFALLDIVVTLLGGGFRIALKVLGEILSYFNIDILEVTANIGDAIVAFHDWLFSLLNISAILDVIVPWIEKVIQWFKELGEEIAASDEFKEFKNNVSDVMNTIVPLFQKVTAAVKEWRDQIAASEELKAFKKHVKSALETLQKFLAKIASPEELKKFVSAVKNAAVAVGKWIASLAKIPGVEQFLDFLKNSLKGIREWLDGLKETDDVAKYIIKGIVLGLLRGINAVWGLITGLGGYIVDGLVKGIGGGAGGVLGAILKIGSIIVEAIKEFFGIHSPSVVMMAIGGFIIAGLVSGISGGSGEVFGAVKELSLGVINMIRGLVDSITRLDAGTLIAAAITGGLVLAVIKVADAIRALGNPIGELGLALSSVGKGFRNYLNAQAVQTLAVSIAILVGSLLALAIFMNTSKNPDAIWEAVGVLAALTGVVAILGATVVALNVLGSKADGSILKSIKNIILPMMVIAASMLVLAIALKKISEVGDPWQSFGVMAAMAAGLLAITLAFGLLANPAFVGYIGTTGSMLMGMAATMLIMLAVMKLSSKMTMEEIKSGIAVITTIGLLFMGILAVCRIGTGDAVAVKGMTGVAMAIGIMVLVVKLAASIDRKDVSRGMSLIWDIGTLFAVIIAVSRFGKFAGAAGGLLLKMSIAMLLMLGVIKIASLISLYDVLSALPAITAITAVCAGMVYMTKYARYAGAAGKMLIKLSIAMLILSGVMFILSLFKPEALIKGLITIGFLSAFIAGLIATSSMLKDSKGIIGPLIVLAVIVGLMAAALVLLSTIDPTRLATASAALTGVIGVFTLLVYSMKVLKGVGSWQDTATKLAPLVVAVGILGLIVAGLSHITNADSAIQSAIAIGILLLSLSASMKILQNVKPLQKSVITSIALLGLVLAELAVILGVMSAFNIEASIPSAIALGVLLIAMSASMLILNNIVVFNNSVIGSLALLSGVVAILGVVLASMRAIKPNSAVKYAEALSMLLIVLTGVAAALSLVGKFGGSITIGVGALIALSIVPLILAGILKDMFILNPNEAISYATALSELLLAMVAAATVLAVIGLAGLSILAGEVALLGMVGIVALLGDVIKGLEDIDVEKAAKIVPTLTPLLNCLTDVMKTLAICGPLALIGTVALAGLVGLITAFGLLAIALGALVSTRFGEGMLYFINEGIPVLEQLAEGLGSVIGHLIKGFSNAVLDIIPSLGDSISKLVESVRKTRLIGSAEVTGMSYLSDAIKAFGTPETAVAIATISIMTFKDLGDKLSEFMDSISGFLERIAEVDPTTVSAIDALADFLNALVNAVTSFEDLTTIRIATFNTNFGMLASGMSDGLSKFKSALSDGITADDCEILKRTGEAMVIMGDVANTMTEGSIFKVSSLVAIIESFESIADSFGKLKEKFPDASWTDADTAMVEQMALAIQYLADASSYIPNEGFSVLSAIVGDNQLDRFVNQFYNVGWSLSKLREMFSENPWTEEDTAAVQHMGNAISALANASKNIPNEGLSFASVFVGDNKLGDFVKYFPGLGLCMRGFINNLGEWKDEDTTTVNKLFEAVGIIIDHAKTLDDNGLMDSIGSAILMGITKWLPTLGQNMADFVKNLGTGFTKDTVDIVHTAALAIKALSESSFDIGKLDGLMSAGAKLPEIASYIKEFANDMSVTSEATLTKCRYAITSIVSDIETFNAISAGSVYSKSKSIKESVELLASAIWKLADLYNDVDQAQYVIDTIKNLINGMADIDTTGIASFTEATKQIANGIVSSLGDTFSGTETATKIGNGVNDMINSAVNAIGEKSESMKTAFEALVSAGAAAIGTEDQYMQFYSNAAYLGDGLVAGIASRSDAAWQAGHNLGQYTINGFRASTRTNSPSKAFYELGTFLALGLTNALHDSEGNTYDAAFDVGAYAERGLSDAISRVRKMIDTGMDTQPTIRPVLDLSDVKSGLGTMNNLLGIGSSHAVLANVGAINTTMNRRSQNGSNDDVVSAIDKLRKDIGNVGSTNYNINGLSYNDNAELDSAFKTIVRVARIGKRV